MRYAQEMLHSTVGIIIKTYAEFFDELDAAIFRAGMNAATRFQLLLRQDTVCIPQLAAPFKELTAPAKLVVFVLTYYNYHTSLDSVKLDMLNIVWDKPGITIPMWRRV